MAAVHPKLRHAVSALALRAPHRHRSVFSGQVRRPPENRQEANFIPPKDRPSVELFHKHCHMVIDSHRLESLPIQGTAWNSMNQINHVSVVTEDETIDARMILLAMGMNNQPLWPHWATLLREQGAPVDHVFDPDFHLNAIESQGTDCSGRLRDQRRATGIASG
jgi:hypothetical protein